MPMIKMPVILCGGAGDEDIEVHVSERPSPADEILVYPTQVDPVYGYTIGLVRGGNLRVIGHVEGFHHAAR
jgi:hypothetical protein